MTKQGFLMGAACFCLLVVTGVSSAGEKGDEQAARLLELMPPGAVSNPDEFETNGFQVKSSRNKELDADLTPTGSQFESLIIEADGVFKVVIEKGRPMSFGGGVGVFHRSSGAPMLTVADRNGDGRVDIVTYSVFNEDGEAIRDVIDYDADGQADLRIHIDKGFPRSGIWSAGIGSRSEKMFVESLSRVGSRKSGTSMAD